MWTLNSVALTLLSITFQQNQMIVKLPYNVAILIDGEDDILEIGDTKR